MKYSDAMYSTITQPYGRKFEAGCKLGDLKQARLTKLIKYWSFAKFGKR